MSSIKSGSNGNVANVGSDKRLDARSIAETFETLFTEESRKYSVSTGLIAVTSDSAIAILTNDGEDNLIVSSNALQIFDVVGTATTTGNVLVESNAVEATGTFSDVDTPFNWNMGSSRTGAFTARKGSDGATFSGATHSVTGFFELPVNIVANVEKFVIEQGNSISVTLNLPTGVTAANVVWMANVYEDNSASIRDL